MDTPLIRMDPRNGLPSASSFAPIQVVHDNRDGGPAPVVAVERLGKADLASWWRSHGLHAVGEYVLPDLFPSTAAIAGAEIAVASFATPPEYPGWPLRSASRCLRRQRCLDCECSFNYRAREWPTNSREWFARETVSIFRTRRRLGSPDVRRFLVAFSTDCSEVFCLNCRAGHWV
jgi:hypothetical protein